VISYRERISEGLVAAKVLIVEDEIIVAEDLRIKLENYGFDVIAVTDSGEKAIEIVKSNRPDLILMDIRIRGHLNGVETAIVIGGLFEEPIPVVFLTAFSQTEFPVLKALDTYIYVNKPFDDHDLLSALKRCLESELPA
jgi:CheY-like chemotaxis protein